MRYSFTRISSNVKTGPIPTTMTEKASCPDTCSLKGKGCYAENFPLRLHWDKLDAKGLSVEELADNIRALPKGQLWRFNVAGDLSGLNDKIDGKALDTIVLANAYRQKKGFTYTHKPMSKKNVALVTDANRRGFAVNVSCDSVDQLFNPAIKHLPKVVILPHDTDQKSFDISGHTIVTCPATYRDDVNCANCGLCADIDRSYTIGFPAHGVRKKKANQISVVAI